MSRTRHEPPAKVNQQTRKLLNRLAKKGYTRVAIGVRDRRIKWSREVDGPQDVYVTAGPTLYNDEDLPALWDAIHEVLGDVYGGIDHCACLLRNHGLTKGRYKYRDGKWLVAKD